MIFSIGDSAMNSRFEDHLFLLDKDTKFSINEFYKRVILWKQGLHERTETCRVYKFSGPN